MTDQTLLIKVRAETNKAIKELGSLTKQVGKLSKENETLSRKKSGIDELSKGYKGLSVSLGSVVSGLAALGVASKAVEFTKLAADAEQSRDAFTRVFSDLGLNATEAFDKIKKASQNLIPDAAIRQSAVVAASLGVPIDKLSQLMEIARAKSREMGTDVKSAFNDLAVGIGRGSPMILDNLGLTIKLEEANKKYADSIGKNVTELSKSDKQMALTNAVIDAGSAAVERYATAGLSANEKMQKMNASLDNLKVKIGTALLPLMEQLTTSTTNWVNSLDEETVKKFGESLNSIASTFIGLGKTLSFLNDILMPDILGGKDAGIIDTAAKGWGRLGEHLNTVQTTYSALSASSNWFDQVDGIQTSIQNFDGLKTTYDELSTKLQKLLAENIKLQDQFRSDGSTFAKNKLAELSTEQQRVLDLSMQLAQQRPVDGIVSPTAVKDVKDIGDAVDQVKNDIEKTPAKVKIESDTEKWAREYNEQLAKLQGTPIKVDVDTTQAETKIVSTQEKAKTPTVAPHTVKVDTSAVDLAIARLKKPTSSVHTIYEKIVSARANGGLIPQRLAVGGTFTGAGKVPGYDSTDSDRVNAKLTGGEFVVKRSAVDAYGTSLLHSINNMSLPKFAKGGEVGGATSSGNIQPINLNIGGKSFKMMSDREVAESLQRFIDSEGGL